MVIQCCVCKKVRNGSAWAKTTVSDSHECDVSHGYCPVCAKKAFAEIKEDYASRRTEESVKV
jgi:hypothetical protein